MVITNWTRKQLALFLIGSNTDYPSYMQIGSGSGTATVQQYDLYKPWNKKAVTYANGSAPMKVTWTGDWNSTEVSGSQLYEWGIVLSGTGFTGSMWSRSALSTPLNFDGTSELRTEETWEVY